MPAMTGRIVSSAVTCGLLASLWACEARRNAEAQNNLGFLYYTGQGVPQDDVEAHMWLNLATAQASAEDRDEYVKERDDVAARMTPEQIAEAQRRAREWTPTDQP